MDKRKAFTKAAFRTLAVLLTVAAISEVIFIRTTEAVSIFTVTNTNDAGVGSFRQAILDANASPGFDIISFNIPGAGVKTILPLTTLPIITDSIFIDGWSQGGILYSGPPLIELSGNGVRGLRLGCTQSVEDNCPESRIGPVDDSTIRGLIINGFSAAGIRIFGNNNTIRGCYVGTTSNGEAALGNTSGIFVVAGGDNLIGGTTASARNVISGNQLDGITVRSDNNRIQGNYIGLSASGLSDLGNGAWGVAIFGHSNLVGGTTPGARNVISGNHGDGILLTGNEPNPIPITNNRIEGNYIDTKSDGVSALGNERRGILISSHAVNNVIGGSTARSGNVIGANGSVRGEGGGIEIHSDGNRVQSNLIGVGADRTTNLGNIGDGIFIAASDTRIGGSFTFSGVSFSFANLIAFNQGAGIRVISLFASDLKAENRILRNEIYSNGALGIDLDPTFGVTANDFCDADGGTNLRQNFPVITSVVPAQGGGIVISGRVNGPSPAYRIELFNNSNCDSSGNGEGEQFLGSTTATSAQFAFCRAFFVVTFPNITIGEGKFITASATDPVGNTSEFSACFDVH